MQKKKTVYEGKGIKLKSLWEITVLMSVGMIATQIFTNIFALRARSLSCEKDVTYNHYIKYNFHNVRFTYIKEMLYITVILNTRINYTYTSFF